MRRTILVLLAVSALVTLAALWAANRPVVVARPNLGGPPSGPPPRVENMVGFDAPSFEAETLDGRTVSTESLRGRVVVLNVWATWCQPCVEELPRLEREVWQRLQPDVAVVAVGRGEKAARIRQFNEQHKLTFALVEDPRSEISRRYGGNGPIPRTFVIDRRGKIVHQTTGYGERGFAELIAAVKKAARS